MEKLVKKAEAEAEVYLENAMDTMAETVLDESGILKSLEEYWHCIPRVPLLLNAMTLERLRQADRAIYMASPGCVNPLKRLFFGGQKNVFP